MHGWMDAWVGRQAGRSSLTSLNSTSPSSPSSLMQSYSEPDCRNNCAKHISSLRNTIFVCRARTHARTQSASSSASVWLPYEARLKPHKEPLFATSGNRASPKGTCPNQSTPPSPPDLPLPPPWISYCLVFNVSLLRAASVSPQVRRVQL